MTGQDIFSNSQKSFIFSFLQIWRPIVYVVGFFLFCFVVYLLFWQNSIALNTIFITFAIYSAIALSTYFLYTYLNRQQRYSFVGIYFHSIIHKQRDCLARIQNIDDNKKKTREEKIEDFMDTLVNTLDDISELFTFITGNKCAVCLKEIRSVSGDEKLRIATLARDTNSAIKRKAFENSVKTRDYPQYLENSTAFSQIIFKGKNYFLCNDIVKLWIEGNYKNTSLDFEDRTPKIKYSFGKVKAVDWPLPYKSTLVTPIRHLETSNFIAFLCIDAGYIDVFDFSYRQLDLVSAISDLLYIFITQFMKSIDE
ncbi:MAG: hypothetical protein LBJ47_04265 [Tannerella sp.]|jgi:bacterioferritin-associated ferredoxin|nr:hypothetical protein [Tannerella sp.]